MTEKQKKFVDEYIKSLNAAESARRAGYAEKNADVTGAKLLVNPSVKSEIEKRLAEIKSVRTAELQEVLEFLTLVMRGEIEEETALSVGYGKTARVEKVMVKPKMKDRLRAAEHLLKLGLESQVKEEKVTSITIRGI